uniref:Ig-like domain-containing protein n=1 Tax=Pygocentrus nattereri TaxID=42514 RepID=A0AAR2LCS1_PYGNA
APLENKTHIYALEDETVNLSCTYDGDVRTLFWYHQYPGSRPENLLLIVPGSKDESHERLKAKVDVKDNRVDLLISSAAVSDSALYYCHDHITPVAALHWLPVQFRIDFKILLLTFKVLNGKAPSYLVKLLKPYKPYRSLRSSNQMLLEQPTSHLKHKGDRAFAVIAPRLWNKLPLHIRTSESTQSFKSSLITYLP